MSINAYSVIGSGTLEQTRAILPPSQRGIEALGKGGRAGTQVILANPEDWNSFDAFAVRDVDVTTSATEIMSPGINPLPRQGHIKIKNTGLSTIYIGPDSTVTATSGYPLDQNEELSIPLLHNVSVYGITSAGTSDVRVIVY